MKYQRIIELAFSPCGNTGKVAHTIAEELAKQYGIELAVEKFTLPKDAEISVVGDADAPYYVPKQENGEPAKFLPANRMLKANFEGRKENQFFI